MQNKNDLYTADSITVLRGLEAVRVRPGMYIGNTDEVSGLLHMIYEVVDNSIDEALAGHCKNIEVILYADGSASVEDDGRGIPCDIHPEEGIPAAEVIMTQLHAGGKFSQDTYKVSGGLHGVGVSVVNALSKFLILKIWRNKKEHLMRFEKGVTVEKLKEIGKSTKNGTFVHFLPDPSVFSQTVFDYNILCNRFQQLAFLNPGVTIKIRDQRDGNVLSKTFYDVGGVKSFVQYICSNKQIINSDPLLIHGELNDVSVDCAIHWTTSYTENALFFTNTIPQTEGGTHVAGLRAGITKAFSNFVKTKGTKVQQKTEFTGDDVREGMVCVLSIKVADPKFSSQTKEKLVSSNVRQAVESLTTKFVESWLEENPANSSKVINKIIESANAREAARRARELSRKGKSSNELNLLVSKTLAACSEKDPTKCQLFIVEGQGAGGSARQARDRFYQAVLPLRGKILNTEKVNLAKALGSEVISTLIAAIGGGIGADFDLLKIKYHKVIIMTDADTDGGHITTLLLTFFLKYMKPLVENGHLYLATPPLYGIVHKTHTDYIIDDKEFAKYILHRGAKGLSITDANNNIIISGEELITFLNTIHHIKEKLGSYPWIYKQALAAKMFLDDEINLNKLLMFVRRHNGQWSMVDAALKRIENGVETKYYFNPETMSRDIKYSLTLFSKSWAHAWGKEVFMNGQEVSDPLIIYDLIMAKGKKGLIIKRFKGLGEMDAKDLSETSMQFFSQIKTQDIEAAFASCRDLMGEDVVPRRQFIEQNAQFANVDS